MTGANIPDFRVTLDGQDLTGKLRPRLIGLTLSEKRGDEADQLDITLDDTDGRLALPGTGAVLQLHIGWRQGADVTPGLVDKGNFTVDEVEHAGPPDQVTIRARSADFTSDLRTRREHSWHDTMIGAVIAEVAGRNGLQPRCATALAAIALPALVQSRESDMALMRRLGREHDAVATIKQGALIFAPIGAGTTARGAPLPALTLRRRDGDRHSYRVEKREEAEGVTASWHDRGEAKRKSVTIGKSSGAKALSHVYASESSARRAAKTTLQRAGRQPVSLSLSLALGRADIYPEQAANVAGFKAEIDAAKWLVAEVSHTIGDRGFVTELKLEGAS